MFSRFLMYGLLGWGIEILWTGVGGFLLHRDWRLQGKTYLWMFPIYGSAAFLLEPLHNSVRSLAWPARGLIWVIAIFAIEYATGYLLRRLTGRCPWDYRPARFAVHGLIRLDYAPAWLVAGFLFERAHDRLVLLTPWLQAAFLGSPPFLRP
ncbi:MAG: putative ABC transporter permease [Symbiobacteriia bacterium]